MIKKFFFEKNDTKYELASFETESAKYQSVLGNGISWDTDVLKESEDPVYHLAYPRLLNIDYVLLNNPTFIEITNLGYTPAKYSVWNGVDFESTEEHKISMLPEKKPETYRVIAVLSDNVYYWGFSRSVSTSSYVSDYIDFLLTNPEIQVEYI